jgi:hypothetical protein
MPVACFEDGYLHSVYFIYECILIFGLDSDARQIGLRGLVPPNFKISLKSLKFMHAFIVAPKINKNKKKRRWTSTINYNNTFFVFNFLFFFSSSIFPHWVDWRLNFIICFDLFFTKLSLSYDLDRGFDGLTRFF